MTMASTCVHVGDIDKILDDAPPALQFIKSYVPALDGPSHERRAAHFSPDATIKTNGDTPITFASMAPMFEMRAKMTMKFWHVVNRLWAVVPPSVDEDITIMMDWTSTTIFEEAEDKPAVVPEFTVFKLCKADEGRGVLGLWIKSAENWMDVSPVKEIRAQLRGAIPQE